MNMKLEVIIIPLSDVDRAKAFYEKLGFRFDGDFAGLASLLRETSEHHGGYEKSHAEHHWWDWYAAYASARQNGSSPEESATSAERYMTEVHHILPR